MQTIHSDPSEFECAIPIHSNILSAGAFAKHQDAKEQAFVWVNVSDATHPFIAMSKIHFIGGEKGGVGKSLVARVVSQYCIDTSIPFIGFDTDRSHGALMRFYSDYASPVVVDDYESLDVIVESAIKDPSRRVLVDLAAQTHQPLVKWMEESGVLETADELGLSFHYWHVMDSGKDSANLLKSLFDRFESRLNYVIVLNQVRGERFDLFEKSAEKKRAEELGAKIITIKRLHETVMNKIDAFSSSFWAATNRSESDSTGLGLLERQRVRVWLKNSYQEIEAAGV